jgi:hypothetical protein
VSTNAGVILQTLPQNVLDTPAEKAVSVFDLMEVFSLSLIQVCRWAKWDSGSCSGSLQIQFSVKLVLRKKARTTARRRSQRVRHSFEKDLLFRSAQKPRQLDVGLFRVSQQ